MTGAWLLTLVALRRDRGRLLLWTVGLIAFATVCAAHVTSLGGEGQRIASLQVAVDNPALLVGRGLPMGASHGAFLFYTYGVLLANVFALFAVLFAVRHGRTEEDDGTRELLRAAATGRIASLAATLVSGTIGVLILAAAMAAGLIIGGADQAGSLRAGLVLALVGAAFLPIGVLCGQLAPTSRAAVGAGFAVVIGLFAVRAAADLGAEVDPQTMVGSPSPLAWFSPFSLAGLTNPYGAPDPWPILVLLGLVVLGAAAAATVEARRELGASILPPRPGPAHAPEGLRTPLRLVLRLNRSTLVAMMLAGALVGAFAAAMAGLALPGGGRNAAIGESIRDVVVGEGPLYDLLLGYVMVLVGECAAVAGALAVLHARREERSGNVESVRATATDPARWFGSVLAAGTLSILLVLASAGLAAAAVHLGRGADTGQVLGVLASVAAQLPAALLYLGVIALVFAVLPHLTVGVAWTILALGVVLAELGGRLGLPGWILGFSPFLHSPLVTMPDARWGGAIWMTAAALSSAAIAVAVHRRRDLHP